MVSDHGQLHVCGQDPGDGRLGLGDQPVTRHQAPDGSDGWSKVGAELGGCVQCSAGGSHGVAVCEGRLYSWGSADGD